MSSTTLVFLTSNPEPEHRRLKNQIRLAHTVHLGSEGNNLTLAYWKNQPAVQVSLVAFTALHPRPSQPTLSADKESSSS